MSYYQRVVEFLKGANWWERGLFALLIWMIVNVLLGVVSSYQALLAYDGPRDAFYFWWPLGLALPWLFVRIVALRSLMGGKYPWLGGLYLLVWAQVFYLAWMARWTWVVWGDDWTTSPQAYWLYPEEIALTLLPAILAGVVIYQRWRLSQVQATS